MSHVGEIWCPKCKGCGQVANDGAETPWIDWKGLDLIMTLLCLGEVMTPKPCPMCNAGTAGPQDKM